MVSKLSVHQALAKLEFVKHLAPQMVALGVRYHTRGQLYRYVLLVPILKDVLLLVSVSIHVLLAELLAVGTIIISYQPLFVNKKLRTWQDSEDPFQVRRKERLKNKIKNVIPIRPN